MRSIRLYQALQAEMNSVGWLLGKQFLRSSTSIGVNIAEAQAAESRADFVHKFAIVQKEARESLYWLRLLDKAGIVSQTRIMPLVRETEEIIVVVTSITVKAKASRMKTNQVT